MSSTRDVAVLVGSLRRESFSRAVALTLIDLAPPSLACGIVEIGNLSLYNQDEDTGQPPADWTALRERIRASAAVLFVTPEYNRSVPGVLKNAIDIASRPYGHNAFDRKPAAVVSVSPGAIGAFGANHHLRQSLAYLNAPTLAQPEAYIGGIEGRLGPDRRVRDESTLKLLRNLMTAFEAWIDTLSPGPAAAGR